VGHDPVMTTSTHPLPPGLREELVASEALATAELRYTLASFGHPAPRAAIRLTPTHEGARAVVIVPPNVPWRVADSATVRALRQVRAVHPRLRLSDRRFEAMLATG
jgi:hypothetical protein